MPEIPPCPPRASYMVRSMPFVGESYALWWQSMAERLLEYAEHHAGCADWHNVAARYCNCGLYELRSAIASAGKEKV